MSGPETREQFHDRISKLAAEHISKPPVKQSSKTSPVAPVRQAPAASGEEAAQAIKELKAIQAEQRAAGWSQTTAAAGSAFNLKMNRESFETACRSVFSANSALQAKHRTWPAYVVARHAELRAEASDRRKTDERGIPLWMVEARKTYARQPVASARLSNRVRLPRARSWSARTLSHSEQRIQAHRSSDV
jgi:hypothetical protein